MIIINLTQHNATQDQLEAGVRELPAELKAKAVEALTFDNIPSTGDIINRARELTWVVQAATTDIPRGDAVGVMIGGAPYLMGHLEDILQEEGFTPLYSFTRRETVEEKLEDGSVKKTAIFKHVGWVDPTRV